MSLLKLTLLLCTLALATPPPAAEAARVLAYFGFSSQSHNNFYTALTSELANRGHDVTVVTPYPLKNPPKKNYRQVEVSTARDFLTSMNTIEAVAGSLWDRLTNFKKNWEVFLICIQTLQTPQVQELKKEKFDLVLVPFILNDCALPFARHNKAPLVLIGPAAGTVHLDLGIGNPEPTAYVPSIMLPYTDHMTFFQRLVNTLVAKFINLFRCIVYLPVVNSANKEFFGPDTPPVKELLKNTSLLILNSHFSLNYPRPYVPAVIEAGGMQIKKDSAPLPKDLQDFLDGAKDGAILFSMGSILKAKDMPAEKVRTFVEAFASLPQKVIWKWEDDNLPGQPKNVKTGAYLPQQSILAHPNVKLFITHGGLLSTQEASYNGVPLIGIPMMGDQWLNVLKSENMGYAVHLTYDTISKDSLVKTIKKVLTEPSYRQKAKQLQARVQDQPQTPLERAVFWTEYVLRHNGAEHMRSAAVDLSWYQLELVDVYLLIIFVFAIVPLLLIYGILNKLCCNNKSKKPTKATEKKKSN